MKSNIDTKKISLLLKQLKDILIAENENNWIRGIQALINEFDQGNMEAASSIYHTMNRGNGSFSDFYIHRDKYEDRVAANKKLNEIRNHLSNTF